MIGILLLTAGLVAPGKVHAQEIIVVRKDGADGASTSISDAIDEIPKKPDTHYIIEIRDSETYEESVKIKKKTKESATLVVRAQDGQQPTIVSSKKKKPAFKIDSSPFVTLHGLILQGGSRQSGVHVAWSDFVTVSDCVVRGTRDADTPGIYVQGGTRGQYRGNTITDNEVGILVFNTADENTFGNNLIYGNRARGLWLYRKSAANQVINNTFFGNGLEIHLGNTGKRKDEPGAGNEFRSNILVAGNGGTCFAVDRQNDPSELPATTVSDYNNLHVAASGAIVGRLDNDTYADLNAWRRGSGADLHSLSTDPLFVGATADFHLQSTAGSYHGGDWTADGSHSPSIDTADPTLDESQEPDPNGSRANMGRYGTTEQASLSASPQPRAEFNEAAQATDGSGRVVVSIEVSHAGGTDTRARIEWSTAARGTYAATSLSGPVDADFDDSGGPPNIDGSNQYQVGPGANTRIVTDSGSNTVTLDWLSATDVPAGDGELWLKLTANDDVEDQTTPAVVAVTVDNVAPAGMSGFASANSTSKSITWSWNPVATESHFDQYSIFYGTNQTAVADGSASQWGPQQDAALASMQTGTTTIDGLTRSTRYFAQLRARDQFGNEVRSAVADFSTAGLDTITHYVAAGGSNDGVPDDRSQPWSSIQRAVSAIPDDLTTIETYYFVHILDSSRYAERVTIDKKTEAGYSITLQAAAGQSPTIAPPNGQFGVVIKSPYVIVEGMVVEASNRYAVDINETDNVTIRDCVLHDGTNNNNGGGVRLLQADHNLLVNNRIHTNAIGVRLARDSDFNRLQSNLILDDGGRRAGVFFARDTDGDSLINNTIVGSTSGLSFQGGNNPAGNGHVIRNTIIHGVDVCIDLAKAIGSTFSHSDYNDLNPNAGGAVAEVRGATYETLAEWRQASGLDGNSLSLDPLFVDQSTAAPAMDLHLRSQAGHWNGSTWVNDNETSPAIDAGNPSDVFGSEPAPNGNRINAGRYGNTVEASRAGGATQIKGGLPYDEYIMIGVPLTPDNGNPDNVLGDDFPGEGEDPWGFWWRLVGWNTPGGGYQYYKEELGLSGDPPDFDPGRGYWLIQWWSIFYDDGSTEGDSVSVSGTNVDLSEDFVIPLIGSGAGLGDDDDDDDRHNAGTPNQVANPFPFDINWGDAKIRDNGSGEVTSVQRAARAGWIDRHAYSWNWNGQTYVPVAGVGRLGRWEGFWVLQLDRSKDLDLLLPPSGSFASAGKVLAHRPTALDWHTEFSVTTQPNEFGQTRQDLHNRAGVSEEASRRFDVNDALDLPALGTPFVRVYFVHDDPEDPETFWPARPGRYTYDIRDPEWEEQEWTFAVETDLIDTEQTWAWTNPDGLPRGFRMALEDA